MNSLDNTNAGNSTRLDEPIDSVAMDSMPQPQDQGREKESHLREDGEALQKDQPSDTPQDAPVKEVTGKEREDIDSDGDRYKNKADNSSTARLGEREDSINAIGAAVEEIKNLPSSSTDVGPVCNITLLLTTGSRHPYRLDAKYLAKRNVQVPEETEAGHPDPFSISIYTLKELILREWRTEWESKPHSPTSIRLIHFGKLLDDKEPLKKYQFSPENPNVVHMSIRPQDLDEEDPRSGSKHLSGSGSEQRLRTGGCCIIL